MSGESAPLQPQAYEAVAPAPVRLNSAQLRELSQQWRQRVDEDPQKVQRVADALEWLATQRDTLPGTLQRQPAERAPSWLHALYRPVRAIWRRARVAGPRLAR